MSPHSVISRNVQGAQQTSSLIVEAICRHTGRQPQDIPVGLRFRDQGIESATALNILADLSERIGCTLSPTLWWQFPTVRALASYLSDSASPEVLPSPNGNDPGRAAVICEPIARGSSSCHRSMLQRSPGTSLTPL